MNKINKKIFAKYFKTFFLSSILIFSNSLFAQNFNFENDENQNQNSTPNENQNSDDFKNDFFDDENLKLDFLDSTNFLDLNNSTDFVEQKTLTVIFENPNLNLNPHTSSLTEEAQILNSLYEGLFSYNPITSESDFELATNFTTSRDGLYWTFTLRDDAKFSNGKKITSRDVKESWLNLLSTQGAYYASFLDIIKGAKNYRLKKGSRENVAIFAKDDFTLSIELNSPLTYLPKLLCHHAFSVFDNSQNSDNNGKPIFSGAYKLNSFTNEKIVLEKNEFYHSAKSVKIPKIEILFSTNAGENAALFNTGKAHWIGANCDVKKILQKDAIKLDAIYGTYFFFFKDGLNKNLTKKVRLALLDATPWEELRKGSLFPATSLVLPSNGYPAPAPLAYTDFDHAKILLDEAKAELGLKSDEQIELTFAIPEGESIFTAATILQNAWKKIGVNLHIKTIYGPYYSSLGKINAEIMLYTWIGDFSDPISFLELFRSDSSLNESHFNSKEFDELLNKANSTFNQNERYEILAQAENLLLSEGFVLPITHSIDLNVVDTNELSGWSSNPQNIHPFKYLFFKTPKSKFNYGIIAKMSK